MPSNSAAMLSMLPKPIQPVPGDSFNDRILLLLAAVANSDDLLTYRGYQLVQEAMSAIFGERALHAELQAKLHYALLNPPSDPTDIARDMAHQADAQKVSASFVEAMLAALVSISAHAERMDARSQSLVRDIEWAFRKSSLERSEGRGFGFGINVGESLSGLYHMATSVLPSRRELESWFSPETGVFNASMEGFASSLERIAWTLDDGELRDELHAFRKTLHDQPFRIVTVGERKRGKSSLINAIIGQELSPVRESTPETATVVAFRYAQAPDYTVRFLDSVQFARLEDYLGNEEGNLLLSRKIDSIRKGVADGSFVPGKLLSGITCWDDLHDYISLGGRFSGFVSRVSIGLPLDILKSGVVMVDTPGLNDTDQFHDYLSYEESLEADCALFVMDARDPGSHSELSLLRKLVRSGRTVSIVGVLTNIDKLNNADSLETAREQARTVLLEACRNSKHIRLAGVVAINARQAVIERCGKSVATSQASTGLHGLTESLGQLLPHRRHPRKTASSGIETSSFMPGSSAGELDELLHILHEVMERDAGKEQYRRKIAESCSRLTRLTKERICTHVAAYRASLPSPELLSMLDAHAEQLTATALDSLEQARQVVDAAARDLDDWDASTEKALARFHETLVLRLMDGVNRKVNATGSDFARDSVWRDFDAGEARALSRRAVDEFLEEQRDILHSWEDKLRLFSAHMDAFSQECLARLSARIVGLEQQESDATNEIFSKASSPAEHFLVKTHRHMKNLAVFTTGVTVGRVTALGPLTLLVTTGNILALAAASPLAGVVFAAMAGTAGLIYHLGREDKRKAAFLEKKRREVENHATRVCEALRQELSGVRSELGKAYEFEVKRGFAPALESLFHQSVHLRLFLSVMTKIRNDVSCYDERVQLKLKELDGVLDTH